MFIVVDKRKLNQILLAFYIILLLQTSFPFVCASNRTVIWAEGKSYNYEVIEGEAKVEHLGLLQVGDTFRMILGGTSDIYVGETWDELKVKFQKTTNGSAGEPTSLVRPYLTSQYPDGNTPLEDISPPFFVWLLNETTRSENGEVHDYFDDLEFNGAQYNSKGVLTFINGSVSVSSGLCSLVIELKPNDFDFSLINLISIITLLGAVISLAAKIIDLIHKMKDKKKEKTSVHN